METDARPLLKHLPRTGGSAMALQRVTLLPRAEGRPTDEGIAWRRRPWGDWAPPRRVMVLNGAMMGRIVQTVRAREWARATARKTRAPLGSDLEAWAQRWRRASGGP